MIYNLLTTWIQENLLFFFSYLLISGKFYSYITLQPQLWYLAHSVKLHKFDCICDLCFNSLPNNSRYTEKGIK